MKKVFAAYLLLHFAFCSLAVAETAIKLPAPKTSGQMSLEESISRRRSERSFYPTAITNEQLSQLLWACQGITDKEWNFRAAPSSGPAYPLEIYIVNQNGVWRYEPLPHRIVMITKGDKRPNLARAALSQQYIIDAPIDIVVTADYNRMREKFGSRSDRYVQIEAGCAAENLMLQGWTLGLGSVPLGGFWDDVVNSTLGLPPEHEPLLIIPVGYVK